MIASDETRSDMSSKFCSVNDESTSSCVVSSVGVVGDDFSIEMSAATRTSSARSSSDVCSVIDALSSSSEIGC